MAMPYHVYITASQTRGTLYTGVTDDIAEAIAREKRLKRWRRAWKIALTEQDNPGWHDLFRRLNR